MRNVIEEKSFTFKFLDELYPDVNDVNTYLYERGCHIGNSGSGNKAMFLGIFLTYEYERTGRKDLLDKINAWFDKMYVFNP